MASFSAFLEVGGSRYPLTYYDLFIHQQTDSLGRPASPTLGGTITVELHSPGQSDTVLAEWMLSPTRQYDGFVHLYRDDTKAKLKTISFFNAYLIDMGEHFSASGSGPMMTQLVISPQRVAVGGIVHDNNWPVASHGSGESFGQQPVASPPVTQSGFADRLADAVGGLAGVVPPLSKSMEEGKVDPPLDPSRGPDYKPDLQPFDPSRTPDYPSADKPTQPTILDSLNRIEKVVDIAKSVAKQVFSSESSELTFPDSEGGSLEGKPTKIDRNEKNSQNLDSLRRENESAVVLSKNGYHVEQLQQTGKNGEKQPDYKLTVRFLTAFRRIQVIQEV